MRGVKRPEMDPLYIIFEQHLYNFQDSDLDRKTFIDNVIRDYVSYLRKKNLVVPRFLEDALAEELSTQIRHMLVKKIYGCLTLQDYQKNLGWGVKRDAQKKYSRLKED